MAYVLLCSFLTFSSLKVLALTRHRSMKRNFASDDDAMYADSSNEQAKKARLELPAHTNAASNERLTLLGLPGGEFNPWRYIWYVTDDHFLELRNQIYNFILLDIPDRSAYESLSEAEQVLHPVVLHVPEKKPMTTHARCMLFSLAQTCRTTRREFRPLYLAKKIVVVPFDLFYGYIEAFAQDGIGDISVRDSAINYVYSSDGIDLLPFIRHDFVGLKVTLELDMAKYRHDGGSILYVIDHVLSPQKSVIQDLAAAGHLMQTHLVHNEQGPNLFDQLSIVITFRFSNEYCATWDPEVSNSMPAEVQKLVSMAKLETFTACTVEDVDLRVLCNAWEKPWSVPRVAAGITRSEFKARMDAGLLYR
jgi:hypothetical protein